MAEQNNNPASNGSQNTDPQGARFEIRQIFLKDVSFESPQAPEVFATPEFSPEISVQMNITHRSLESSNESADSEGFHEVVLNVTVNAKLQEKDVFLCEVQQAGVFFLQGIPEADQPLIFEVHCANVLLPYAREAIDDMVIKGGFPALRIHPVNFEAIFRQRQASGGQATPATS